MTDVGLRKQKNRVAEMNPPPVAFSAQEIIIVVIVGEVIALLLPGG